MVPTTVFCGFYQSEIQAMPPFPIWALESGKIENPHLAQLTQARMLQINFALSQMSEPGIGCFLSTALCQWVIFLLLSRYFLYLCQQFDHHFVFILLGTCWMSQICKLMLFFKSNFEIWRLFFLQIFFCPFYSLLSSLDFHYIHDSALDAVPGVCEFLCICCACQGSLFIFFCSSLSIFIIAASETVSINCLFSWV